MAEDSASGGHVESARQAYLWAQNFYDGAIYFADGSGDPTRVTTAWQLMDDCWLKSIALFDPPIEQVSIPYEGTALAWLLFPGQEHQGEAPAADPQQRQRRLCARYVDAGRGGSDGARLRLPHLRWAWARLRALEAGPPLPAGLGACHNAGRRLCPRPRAALIRSGSRFRASARADTGSHAPSPSRSGSRPLSQIRAWSTSPHRGLPPCRRR